MRLRYPPHAHAPTGRDAACSADHGSSDWEPPEPSVPRIWRVVDNEPLVDVRHARPDLGLEPRTTLRLDGIRRGEITYPPDGPQWQRGTYEVTERRVSAPGGGEGGAGWGAGGARAAGGRA